MLFDSTKRDDIFHSVTGGWLLSLKRPSWDGSALQLDLQVAQMHVC